MEIPQLPARKAYAYLLGLYLGDGCISVMQGVYSKQVWSLRIMCDTWPGLQEECDSWRFCQ